MLLADVLRLIAAHRAELVTYGAESLSVFGSVARDEAGPDSDVDLLVEIKRPMGLFGFVRLQRYLEEILGRPVDLATPDMIEPAMREQVFQEAVSAT